MNKFWFPTDSAVGLSFLAPHSSPLTPPHYFTMLLLLLLTLPYFSPLIREAGHQLTTSTTFITILRQTCDGIKINNHSRNSKKREWEGETSEESKVSERSEESEDSLGCDEVKFKRMMSEESGVRGEE